MGVRFATAIPEILRQIEKLHEHEIEREYGDDGENDSDSGHSETRESSDRRR